MVTAVAYKTPDEVKDYGIDYTKELLAGEFIVSSIWTSSSPFLSVNTPNPTINQTGTITTVWLSGGSTNQGADNVVTVTNEVTTNQGRIMENSFPCIVTKYIKNLLPSS